jgi:hypothetical protein
VTSLSAPTTSGANTFQKWQKDGVDYSTNATAVVTNDANHTLTAVYVATRTLTVNSSNPNSGISVTTAPADNNGAVGGVTSFALAYGSAVVTSLTAPTTSGANTFQKWQKDGVDYSTNATAVVTNDANHTLTAVYVPTRTLTVKSLNPSSGITVTASPTDNNGAVSGVTQFSLAYGSGVVASLSAPTTSGTNTFQKWQKDGVDYATSTTAVVTNDSDHALTAVYVPTWTLTINSFNPNSGISVSVSPADNSGVVSGVTTFTLSYGGGTLANLSAPPTSGTNLFQKWQEDGADYTTNLTAVVTNDANHTLTAVYAPPDPVLTINSQNPASGVTVTSSPQDVSGMSGGVTGFTLAYSSGTTVTLTAPGSVGGNTFQKWQKDGADYSTSPSTNLVLDTDHTMTAVFASQVLGAYVFYNNSAYDKNDPTANTNDDGAIAIDKVPLRPGSKASFANYTSYSRGINGVMVDISAVAGTPSLSDFTFKIGNDSNPAGWAAAPNPTTIALRAGAGTNSSDRVTLVWPDKSVQKQWLEITVLAGPSTGLAAPFTFYFGNAIGECGNSPTDAKVDPADELQARAHQSNPLNPLPIDNHFDYNRDNRVDPADELIARANQTSVLNALSLIDLSGVLLNSIPARSSGQASIRLASSPVRPESSSERNLVTRVTLDGLGQFVVEYVGGSNQTYRLQSTDRLGAPWADVGIPAPSDENGAFRWAAPIESAIPQRFFRMVLEPVASQKGNGQ